MPELPAGAPRALRSAIRAFRLRRRRAHRHARAGRLFRGVVSAGAPPNRGQLDRNRTSAPPERLRPRNRSQPGFAAALAELLARVESGSITGASGKKVFATMFETGKSAEEIIAAEGLSQIQDTGEIERLCREVIEKNPDNVAKYRAGNEGVFKFFVAR